jgi:hypothetical protein
LRAVFSPCFVRSLPFPVFVSYGNGGRFNNYKAGYGAEGNSGFGYSDDACGDNSHNNVVADVSDTGTTWGKIQLEQ